MDDPCITETIRAGAQRKSGDPSGRNNSGKQSKLTICLQPNYMKMKDATDSSVICKDKSLYFLQEER